MTGPRTVLLFLVACVAAAQTAAPKPPAPEAEDSADQESQFQLSRVRRVYVDLLSGGESAIKIRDLLMSSLQAARVLIVTEDEDKADAVLKGSGEDSVFFQTFSSSEGLNARSQVSLPTSSGSGTGRYSSRADASVGVGENESRHSEERKHEAIATLRLVNKDGDVIWSTTQESFGGKFMGAAADVADKVAKKLGADMKRAKRASPPE